MKTYMKTLILCLFFYKISLTNTQNALFSHRKQFFSEKQFKKEEFKKFQNVSSLINKKEIKNVYFALRNRKITLLIIHKMPYFHTENNYFSEKEEFKKFQIFSSLINKKEMKKNQIFCTSKSQKLPY